MNLPKKKTSSNLSCLFFLMEPQTPQLPNRNPLAPGPVSWRHGTVDFDTTTTWELWSSSAHRPWTNWKAAPAGKIDLLSKKRVGWLNRTNPFEKNMRKSKWDHLPQGFGVNIFEKTYWKPPSPENYRRIAFFSQAFFWGLNLTLDKN